MTAECTCGQRSGYEGYDACRQGCDEDCPVCSNPYSDSTPAELADALEGLADGQDDEMGQLLSAAVARLRTLVMRLDAAEERLTAIEQAWLRERP
jgi:hypothetical protein